MRNWQFPKESRNSGSGCELPWLRDDREVRRKYKFVVSRCIDRCLTVLVGYSYLVRIPWSLADNANLPEVVGYLSVHTERENSQSKLEIRFLLGVTNRSSEGLQGERLAGPTTGWLWAVSRCNLPQGPEERAREERTKKFVVELRKKFRQRQLLVNLSDSIARCNIECIMKLKHFGPTNDGIFLNFYVRNNVDSESLGNLPRLNNV